MEFLLPADPRFAQAQRALRHELAARFGGVTSHVRTPARGLWQEGGGDIEADDVVAHEVLVPRLDPRWWSAFRRRLEVDFEQDVVVLRASRVRML
ncbi:MAG TPA: hypothetical protein VFY71_14350 [Planctomycetota bacterium]|nr:hypothetical protein [Planctomycetota bacterium]